MAREWRRAEGEILGLAEHVQYRRPKPPGSRSLLKSENLLKRADSSWDLQCWVLILGGFFGGSARSHPAPACHCCWPVTGQAG